ncbi:hypothetical protein B0T25DRAFT_90892 [Lasiosphaeria hispida]|uniref:Uncharacterized protein n=1 Tax=Lasiosphaeria hispida TaxID=260671 RepID=A0AAJ0MHQ9_9PEZI|nr:hypothetical protein B0T25DRAFT_90892 [Lasiosphaeria hispida]
MGRNRPPISRYLWETGAANWGIHCIDKTKTFFEFNKQRITHSPPLFGFGFFFLLLYILFYIPSSDIEPFLFSFLYCLFLITSLLLGYGIERTEYSLI